MNEERDELWQLLGWAKQPDVSPFFAANVLREIRAEKPAAGALSSWWKQWRLIGATATALLVVGLTAQYFWTDTPAAPQKEFLLVQEAGSDLDFDAISRLDELIAYQETSLWTDTSDE
jgi:hypothetical protein